MEFEPKQHFVLIKFLSRPTDTFINGVWLVTKGVRDRDYGEVVKVGPIVVNELKPGDKVVFIPDCGTYVDNNGEKCMLVEYGYILYKIED